MENYTNEWHKEFIKGLKYPSLSIRINNNELIVENPTLTGVLKQAIVSAYAIVHHKPKVKAQKSYTDKEIFLQELQNRETTKDKIRSIRILRILGREYSKDTEIIGRETFYLGTNQTSEVDYRVEKVGYTRLKIVPLKPTKYTPFQLVQMMRELKNAIPRKLETRITENMAI